MTKIGGDSVQQARRSINLAGYQQEIYQRALVASQTGLPVAADELERRAREQLDPRAYDYIAGGAGAEDTVRDNLEAFRRWRIVPRMLRDVAERDLSCSLLGTELAAPVMLAPIGVQSIAHPEAELAVARAAAQTATPMVLSTSSSKTIEEVGKASGDAVRWFQLYWPSDPNLAASFLARAEAAGYSAVVVTLDTWLLGWRPRDLQSSYLPFLQGEGVANYFSDPVFRSALAEPPEQDLQAAVAHWTSVFSDATVSWDDLGWLREQTRLPILLKGILHPADARRAAEVGMDAIVVSNHGGRQVEGAVAALDALGAAVDAVPAQFPVLFDGGIRTGADVFKALALGARAVFLGRPYIWGLALDGEQGVTHVIKSLLAELDLTLALSGLSSVAAIDRSALARAGSPLGA